MVIEKLFYESCGKCVPGTAALVGKVKLPFYCRSCLCLSFPFSPVPEVVILYPIPKIIAETLNIDCARTLAVVLAIQKEGSPIVPGDIVAFCRQVPWTYPVEGTDGVQHRVVLANVEDIEVVKERVTNVQ